MRANEISTILEDLKDNEYNRILIDGPWGIGKTEHILRSVNKNKMSYCYISLFGKKNLHELLEDIYFKLLEGYTLTGIEKAYYKTLKKLKKVDVSTKYGGVSIPIIKDLLKPLINELESRKQKYIIIFDDLERKHDDLNIKEILGLVDVLANTINAKIVLVGYIENLYSERKKNNDERDVFFKYKEKAIERTYHIHNYSEDAPKNILSEEIWDSLKDLIENHEVKNLRTFIKIRNFINEILLMLKREKLLDTNKKAKIYKMSFGVILFNIEHRREMKLLDESGLNGIYTEGANRFLYYIDEKILNRNFSNSIYLELLFHIIEWYEKGVCNIEAMVSILNKIDAPKREPLSIRSSQDEVIDFIEEVENKIEILDGLDDLQNLMDDLAIALNWCDLLSLQFNFTDEEILLKITSTIDSFIDINKTADSNAMIAYKMHTETGRVSKVFKLVNDTILKRYFLKLFNTIKTSYSNGNCSNKHYIFRLNDQLYLHKDGIGDIIKIIATDMKENDFLFTIPEGKINDDISGWCIHLVSLIKFIGNYEGGIFYEEFKKYVCNIAYSKNDAMLLHRLREYLGDNTI